MTSSSGTFPIIPYRRWILALALAAALWYIPAAFAGDVGVREGVKFLELLETEGNGSFRCSPAGPCVRCQYSEKIDGIYHCSETGYHTPLKCVEDKVDKEEGSNGKPQGRVLSFENEDNIVDMKPIKVFPSIFLSSTRHLKWRKLLDTSSKLESTKKNYLTYRSCIPVEPDEKLSFLGFEAIMLCLLLISGPVAYFRQRRSTAMAGVAPTRIPTNVTRL